MKRLLAIVTLLIIAQHVFAQHPFAQADIRGLARMEQKQHHHSTSKITVLSAAENDYDVKHVKLDLTIPDTSTYISGNATTTAQVVSASMSQYVFEFDSALTIDSAIFNGSLLSVTSSGDLRTITLGQPLAAGTSFTVQIYYHGYPVAYTNNTGTLVTGIIYGVDPANGDTVTYTESESYEAKNWWPCKQSLTDKIDSTDVWLTVPVGKKAGSNGLLQTITPINSNYNRYEWKNNKTIDYYLVSLSVANYVDYSYYMHFNGSTDSMLIQNYVYDSATLDTNKQVLDSVGGMVNFFSGIFGRYPFWQQKYGHSFAPIGGGEENQTMTTIGPSPLDFLTVAHELSHQWFGDNVTCGTWKDIFMNEGFATYNEYLYLQTLVPQQSAIQYMQENQDEALIEPGGSIYVSDTTNEDIIFDYRLSYSKGADVLHMLRFLANNDSLFFLSYKTYQQQYGGKTGTIEDFKNVAVQVLNRNLDTFFNQWIYDEGYPFYHLTWNQVDSQIFFKITQISSEPASVPVFSMPIEISFHSGNFDTTVRVYNNADTQLYSFVWNHPVGSAPLFDPNYWLLDKHSVKAAPDHSLGVPMVADKNNITIYPNPASTSWQIQGLNADSYLRLVDIAGHLIWQRQVTGPNCTIPATGLATGMYTLSIDNKKNTTVYKLTKE